MCSQGSDSSSLAPKQERGAWRVAPAMGEAQTCTSNSTCHEEAEWPFERQALEIKGSDDWYEICPCLLSDSFLRQRPSSVNHLHVCVTVIIAVLNINVKGYWAVGINQTVLACVYQTDLPLLRVLLSPLQRLLRSMGSSCRNSNLSQDYRLYFHTQIWHIHTLDLFLPVLSKLYQWRERERFALTVFLR